MIRVILVTLSFLFTISAFAQLPGGGGGRDRIDGKFKFIPLPYVDYNRSLGLSLGALPIGMMNLSEKDTISPSSTVGLFGMYTENKTWFAMGFGVFYLAEDRWRVIAAGGLGDVQFQFYAATPINQWFDYNTNTDFLYLSVQRRIIPHLYAGMGYVYTAFETNSDFFVDTAGTQLHGIAFSAAYDQRSNVSYPRNGYYIDLTYNTYPEFIGNDEPTNRIKFAYNHYFPSRQYKDVVAGRFFSGIGLGDVSFNQQFIVGGTDIRGYSLGEFRGDIQLALQGEYRWNFHKRMGAVGFGGVATVLGANNDEDEGQMLPGAGVGFRYVFMKDTHSTVGIDAAVGDGDWGIYFRFSEAF